MRSVYTASPGPLTEGAPVTHGNWLMKAVDTGCLLSPVTCHPPAGVPGVTSVTQHLDSNLALGKASGITQLQGLGLWPPNNMPVS